MHIVNTKIGSAFVFFLSPCVIVTCVFVSVCIPLFHQYVRWFGVNQVCGVCCAFYIVSSFEIFLLKYLLFSFIYVVRAIFIYVYRNAFIMFFLFFLFHSYIIILLYYINIFFY